MATTKPKTKIKTDIKSPTLAKSVAAVVVAAGVLTPGPHGIQKVKQPHQEYARWPIDKLIPYPNNPRRNDAAVPVVAKSLDEFGQKQAIVVDKDGVIVVGHTRWRAMQMLGWDECDVLIAYDLTPEQCAAYRLADNRTGEVSEWDDAKLVQELSLIKDQGFDLKGMGFSEAELQELVTPTKKEDKRYLEDFEVMPVPKPRWILISAPEDEAAQIMGAVNAMGLHNVKMEYSGAPSQPMNHKTGATKAGVGGASVPKKVEAESIDDAAAQLAGIS